MDVTDLTAEVERLRQGMRERDAEDQRQETARAALEQALADVADRYVPVDETIDIPVIVNRAALKIAERERERQADRAAISDYRRVLSRYWGFEQIAAHWEKKHAGAIARASKPEGAKV